MRCAGNEVKRFINLRRQAGEKKKLRGKKKRNSLARRFICISSPPRSLVSFRMETILCPFHTLHSSHLITLVIFLPRITKRIPYSASYYIHVRVFFHKVPRVVSGCNELCLSSGLTTCALDFNLDGSMPRTWLCMQLRASCSRECACLLRDLDLPLQQPRVSCSLRIPFTQKR